MVVQEFSIQLYFVRLFGGSTNTGCGENKGEIRHLCCFNVSLTFSSGWTEYDNKTFALGGRYSTEELVATDVSTHYTDYAIGRDFFHELYRMHRDALSDGARKAIDKIFGPESGDVSSSSNNDDNNDVAQYWRTIAIFALCTIFLLVVVLIVSLFRGKGTLFKEKEEVVMRDIEAKNAMH